MSSAYQRSVSEPRERRSYTREPRERGTSFWNPSAPRNLDADTWRRGTETTEQSQQPTQQMTHPGRGREDRDRSRIRNERPSSRDGRGSGGEYRHPRDYSNGGSRYPNTYRGRGRGRGNSRNEPVIDVKGYRPYQRYGPPGGPGAMQSSGQGTQFFAPLHPVPVDHSKFNATEALALFAQRWKAVSSDLNKESLTENQKPHLYKPDNSQNGVWGQPKWHVQPSVSDFLTELKLAVERDQKKQLDAEESNQPQPPQPEQQQEETETFHL